MAITPQLAERNAELRTKHKLAYPILADTDNAYAKQLGIAHALPDDLVEVYSGFGVDLPGAHGTDSWELPMPTRIVVAADGTIRDVAADPDYTRRPEPEATLEILKSL